jgi:hypothetical protein
MGLQIRSPEAQIHTLQHAHSGAVASKTPVVIGSRVLIPLHAADALATAAYVYRAEISGGPKASGAIALNAPVYWDASAGNFTATSSGNTLCGHAIQAMGAGDTTTGLIAFNAYAA